jgi:hypothetical protein
MEEGSSSIGTISRLSAPQDSAVSVGHRPSTTEPTRSSRLSSPPLMVGAVRARSTVSVQQRSTSGAPSPSDRRLNMKRCQPPVGGLRRPPLPKSMRCARGSKRRFRKRVRAFGMRRSRYIGFAKTHLHHLGIAAAINLVRVVAWLDGDEPAPTRVSAFQKLSQAA